MARLELVTGASTGIGRACTAQLAGLGYTVLAGVRDAGDAPPFAGVEPPMLDVERADDVIGEMREDARRRYDGVIAAVRSEAERLAREGLRPEAVASVVGRAFTARRPRTRYVVGREARAQATLARFLPDRAFDALVSRRLT